MAETEVRLRLGSLDCIWTVMIVSTHSHDCILGSHFFQYYRCQINYDTGTFVVGDAEIPIRYSKVAPSVCGVFLCVEVGSEPGTEQVLKVALEMNMNKTLEILEF